MADISYGRIPFLEQIAFFLRKLNLPSNAWTDIWMQAHDHAFVVAGANRDEIVADFRAAIDKAITQGTTLAEFRKDFDAIVAKYGWDYNGGRNWRSQVIYETNLRSSYAAGRYAQLQKQKAMMPYWQYVHSDLVMHPRPLHLAWNGLVLSADDPWWQTHFPPNGWGCRCSVRGLEASDLKRLGKDGPDIAPPLDMQTVTVGMRGPTPRTVQTPAGIDPGWGYAPGMDAFNSWLDSMAQAALDAGEADAAWEPLIQTTAQDLGLAPLDAVALPVPLGPQLESAAEIVAALTELLGGDSRVFDVKGIPLAITAQVLGNYISKQPGRTPWLPLLIDLLADPQEVWYMIERSLKTGITRVSTRLIKRYDVGKGKALYFVAVDVDGMLEGWTVYPNRTIESKRQGLLWWSALQDAAE